MMERSTAPIEGTSPTESDSSDRMFSITSQPSVVDPPRLRVDESFLVPVATWRNEY